MEHLGIFVALSVACLTIAAFSIPFFLQLWRTAKSMALTLQLLNQNLPGILKNLEEITTNANRTTTIVTREVEDLSLTIRKLQGTLGLVGVEEIVRETSIWPFPTKCGRRWRWRRVSGYSRLSVEQTPDAIG